MKKIPILLIINFHYSIVVVIKITVFIKFSIVILWRKQRLLII